MEWLNEGRGGGGEGRRGGGGYKERENWEFNTSLVRNKTEKHKKTQSRVVKSHCISTQ